jgi:hypothetical protein
MLDGTFHIRFLIWKNFTYKVPSLLSNNITAI